MQLGSWFVERAPFNPLVLASNSMQLFGLLYPGEKQVLNFSFAPVLLFGNLLTTAATPAVKFTCLFGNDGDPIAIKTGAAAVNPLPITLNTPSGGQIVLPAFTAVQFPVTASAIPGAVYVIEVQAQSANENIAPICAGKLINGYP